MTKSEAELLVQSLTLEEKMRLDELLSYLAQSHQNENTASAVESKRGEY